MSNGNERLFHGVCVVGAVSVVVFLAAPVGSFCQIVAWFVPLLVAAGVLAQRLRTALRPARGLLWLLLAGQFTYLGASLGWYLWPIGSGHALPFPSPADAVYFGAYSVYAVFLSLLLSRYRGLDNRIAWTDSSIMTVSLSSVLWAAVIGPQLSDALPLLPTAAAVAYPVFTLLLFLLATRLVISARFMGTSPGILLVAWIGAELTGDIFYGFQNANGSFTYTGPVMVTWMLSSTALGAFAAHSGMTRLLEARETARTAPADRAGSLLTDRVRLALLLIAALIPLGLGTFSRTGSIVDFLVAGLAFALVIYRAAVVGGDLRRQQQLSAELEEAAEHLRAQRDELSRYAAIVASTSDAIISVSPVGIISDWNRGAERMYGYTAQEAVGQHVAMISTGQGYVAMRDLADHLGHGTLERVDIRKDGTTLQTSMTVSLVHDESGAVIARVGIARDITERKRAEAQAQEAARALAVQARQMERLAFHDPVTGLGNRALLHQRAEVILLDPEGTAVLLLDLDGFKEVNDTLGHAAGDALLLEVGERLGSCTRTQDTVVRLGGDEFAILLPDTGMTAANSTADRILRQLRRPFLLDGTPVQVRGSIGITFGCPGGDLDEMLRRADLAMYAAKAAGRDQARMFDSGMHERATQRLRDDTDLRTALARRQFAVYYQPILSAATGAVSAVEALVRWDHPQRGMVPPADFLPAAERSGVIIELGRYVLETACAQLVQWRAQWPDLAVGVNVSHRELLDPGFARHVGEVLESTGLPPHALHLEITETVLVAEEDIQAALQPLLAAGVQFSIDDFGTGQSSLSRLRDLPVHRLKIDKSFIGEIDENGNAPLLASIIALAHSLGRVVVAEGVETPQQATFLIDHGCEELQGYLFARPVAAPQVVPLLLGARTGIKAVGGTGTVFPPLITRILDPAQPLREVVPTLLAELTAISGLQSAFITQVVPDPAQQITRFSHNSEPAAMDVEEGLTVDWDQALCRRMVEDELLWRTGVSNDYSDVPAVRNLGIETFVSVPIYDDRGSLSGTLCAASSRTAAVDESVIGLMQLFARALATRAADTIPSR
jgi:diguanylate cyclase (GGDEF)-like protein/PAS domain S-box-containing protein